MSVYNKSIASTSQVPVDALQDGASPVFTATIGKIDAGIAVLISDSVHLIEFPSLLLPAGVGPGSIVNISCTRNLPAERATTTAFWDLQHDILAEFGDREPVAPQLRVRNTTQTSVTLEWDKLELAKSKLLGLAIWRNGQRLTSIPNPLHNTSTKLSGLALDTDYTFHLVLKTSAGTFTSPVVKIHTHTIEDTSGVSVCFGLVEPHQLLDEAHTALRTMKGRHADKIQIDTTHFVATSPASVANPTGGPSVEFQKALQLSIPVVSPEWLIACAREHKLVAIANYYSIGTTNHAASLSSAQLVSPTGVPHLSSTSREQPRRAAAVAEEDEQEQQDGRGGSPVPAVAPSPPNMPPSELAEEEPDAPPEGVTAYAAVGESAPATLETEEEPEEPLPVPEKDVLPQPEEPEAEKADDEAEAEVESEELELRQPAAENHATSETTEAQKDDGVDDLVHWKGDAPATVPAVKEAGDSQEADDEEDATEKEGHVEAGGVGYSSMANKSAEDAMDDVGL